MSSSIPPVSSITGYSRCIPAPLKDWRVVSCVLAALALLAIVAQRYRKPSGTNPPQNLPKPPVTDANPKLNPDPRPVPPSIAKILAALKFTPDQLNEETTQVSLPTGVTTRQTFRDVCCQIILIIEGERTKNPSIIFRKSHVIHDLSHQEKMKSWFYQTFEALKRESYINNFKITEEKVVIHFNPPLQIKEDTSENLGFSLRELNAKIDLPTERSGESIRWTFSEFCRHVLVIVHDELKHAGPNNITFGPSNAIWDFRNYGLALDQPFETATSDQKKQSWLYQVLEALENRNYIAGFSITDKVTVTLKT